MAVSAGNTGSRSEGQCRVFLFRTGHQDDRQTGKEGRYDKESGTASRTCTIAGDRGRGIAIAEGGECSRFKNTHGFQCLKSEGCEGLIIIAVRSLRRRLDLLLGLGAFPESVLEAAGDVLHVAHPARALRAPALGLEAPVVLPHAGVGVPARSAPLLLDVEGNLPAPPARRVRLVVSLTE